MKRLKKTEHSNCLCAEKSTGKWMTCPTGYVEFPGLAYIYPLNRLIVAKKLDKLHQIIGISDKNVIGYVYNNQGEKVFLAVQRHQYKQFTIKIFNIYGNEVIQITKNCSDALNKILVWAPADNFAGSVERRSGGYDVKDKNGTVVLMIESLKLQKSEYRVLKQGEEVGLMGKEDHDSFGVTFPEELEVELKAVLVAACFFDSLKC